MPLLTRRRETNGVIVYDEGAPASPPSGGITWKQLGVIIALVGLLAGGVFKVAFALGRIEQALVNLDDRLKNLEGTK